MAFKMYWELKDKVGAFSGPILGKVTNCIFLPDNKEQAFAKVKRISKYAKRARYSIMEVPFQQRDRREIETVYSFITEFIDIGPDMTTEELTVNFFTVSGKKVYNSFFPLTEDWDLEEEEIEEKEDDIRQPLSLKDLEKRWGRLK